MNRHGVGNLQLTLANGIAAEAEQRWKAHKRDCPKCSQAQRHRAPAEMCNRGGELYEDRKVTAADLARERRLAKDPIPGQQELFPELAASPGRSRLPATPSTPR